jgi:hypothetical protein
LISLIFLITIPRISSFAEANFLALLAPNSVLLTKVPAEIFSFDEISYDPIEAVPVHRKVLERPSEWSKLPYILTTDFISRYFAPSVGIDEDPVCGSAHCRLIPYWAKKLKKDEMIAYQASMRGGIIRCKDLGDRVIISGQSISTHSYELPILQKVNYK